MVRKSGMQLFPFRRCQGPGPTASCSRLTIPVLGAFFLCSALVGTAQASQAEASDQGVKINVGVAAAKPGDPIDIPVTLSGGEQVQAGSVITQVSFPKASLSYVAVEAGLAAELAEGQTQGTLQEDKEDSSLTLLEINITGKNPIKPGILVYMKFRVSTDAQKGVIPLKLRDAKVTVSGGGPAQLAKGDDGEVTIFALDEEIPVVGCFFFTH